MTTNFLGKGPAYPFKRNTAGVWNMAEGDDLVLMGIQIAIFTGIGERPMFKDLGSRLSNILFMPEDSNRDALVKQFVQEAVAQIEPRTVILNVTAKNNGDELNRIDINVSWLTITKNVPTNAVFPYYTGGS